MTDTPGSKEEGVEGGGLKIRIRKFLRFYFVNQHFVMRPKDILPRIVVKNKA